MSDIGPSGRIGQTEGEFSVVQFFAENTGLTYEYVRRWVSAEEAMKAAKHYCTSIAAKLGVVNRVIITDGGDHTNFEWKFGEGVVFPSPEKKEGKDANAKTGEE